MIKNVFAVVITCVFAFGIVACSSTSSSSNTATIASSSSGVSSSSSVSSSNASASASSSAALPESSADKVNKLLSKCAQDFYDIGDPLTDAIFANNTSKVEGFKKTVDTDLEQLNSLIDIPEEYHAGVDCMKNCLSKYSEAIGFYAEGSKYVNKNDSKADEYFAQADPLAAEANDSYNACFDALGGLVVKPTKRSSTTSTSAATNTSAAKPSAGTGTGTTTSKPGVDATKKYQVGDRTDRLTGTVTKKTSDTYWVDGDDGIEYKCWPDNKKDLEFFAPGNKIEFSGVVKSTSKLSCNLEHTLWLGTK